VGDGHLAAAEEYGHPQVASLVVVGDGDGVEVDEAERVDEKHGEDDHPGGVIIVRVPTKDDPVQQRSCSIDVRVAALGTGIRELRDT
jgi:hypothetical protein